MKLECCRSVVENNANEMIEEWLKSLEWKHFKNYVHFDISKKFKDSQEKLKFFENLFFQIIY